MLSIRLKIENYFAKIHDSDVFLQSSLEEVIYININLLRNSNYAWCAFFLPHLTQ